MPRPIATLIDHALLHPTLTDAQFVAGCELAARLGVATVCVKPYAVAEAASLLAGSGIGVSTVIGFPHGSATTALKAAETHEACDLGAREVDMVINVGKALSGDWAYVEKDIRAVVDAAHAHGALAKVIFETDYLRDDPVKIRLCQIASAAGADFVKTSTGFGFIPRPEGGFETHGATDHDLKLMRTHADPRVGVKASGGIRTYADALRVVALGATRIGTSASQAIVAGEANQTAAPVSASQPGNY